MDPNVAVTPELVGEHGLTEEEYQRLCDALGREPNITELGIASVMWSEHCSYKSSKMWLKHLPTSGARVLQGPGENAGIIDIGDGIAVCFKIESHNHPSFIEPYQGAATGVGGILRDIFTMGARPIANLNSLRFGAPHHPKTAHLLRGVVAGIGGYGNTMGIPTVGGEVSFNECYNDNILVNAFTLGLMDAKHIFRGHASGVGNPVIYVGSKTGRDGIHGATMASSEFDDVSDDKRPTVQVGDPFTEKRLLEACLELMQTGCIVGIQDMGAAGLTCSSFEMADRADSGMVLDLDRVPTRAEEMTPYEMMLSESQERMLLVVEEGKQDIARRIFEKWDLDMALVGRVTDDHRVRVLHRGEVVVDMPVSPLVHDAPKYDRPCAEPVSQKELTCFDARALPIPKNCNEVLVKLLGSPNLGSKSWVWEQYDHMVMTNTVVLPGSDASVIRIKNTKKGIALTVDCNSRVCFLDPYMGAMLSVFEAARNLSCVGGEPLAITNCLNFGSPEKPEVMWQFRQALAGMTDACRKLSTPVVSGNVSFYNETNGKAIFPTPTIAMVGLLEEVTRPCTMWWKDTGDVIILFGKNEFELGGSEYLKEIHGKVSGLPPTLDVERELAGQRTCRICIARGFLKSAHDVSEGGLAVALAECSLSRPYGLIGAKVTLHDDVRPDGLLFGEAASRIIVSVAKADVEKVLTIAQEEGAKGEVIGEVGGRTLTITPGIDADLTDLYKVWMSAIPNIVQQQ